MSRQATVDMGELSKIATFLQSKVFLHADTLEVALESLEVVGATPQELQDIGMKFCAYPNDGLRLEDL